MLHYIAYKMQVHDALEAVRTWEMLPFFSSEIQMQSPNLLILNKPGKSKQ